LVLWNGDGSIGLLVPLQSERGIYDLAMTFEGNLGAEAPCITQNGYAVTEFVPVGSVVLGPRIRHFPRLERVPEVPPSASAALLAAMAGVIET
jgi:hypothetical protein